jgi:hypothetical protein
MPLRSRKSRRIDGVLHGVDVDAESLYEAVAIAVAQFREDDVNPQDPGPMTEYTVGRLLESSRAHDQAGAGGELGRAQHARWTGRNHDVAEGAATTGQATASHSPLRSDPV